MDDVVGMETEKMSADTARLSKGDHVCRLSDGRPGVVTGFSRERGCIGVTWHGSRTQAAYHRSLLTYLPTEPVAPWRKQA